MSETLTYPRLLYRGAEDETAETLAAADAAAGAAALTTGWRLQRVCATPTPAVAAPAPDHKPHAAKRGKS